MPKETKFTETTQPPSINFADFVSSLKSRPPALSNDATQPDKSKHRPTKTRTKKNVNQKRLSKPNDMKLPGNNRTVSVKSSPNDGANVVPESTQLNRVEKVIKNPQTYVLCNENPHLPLHKISQDVCGAAFSYAFY